MSRDFPGSLVVKISPSKGRRGSSSSSIPGWRAKIPYALGSKNQSIKKKSNTVTRSKKTKTKKKKRSTSKKFLKQTALNKIKSPVYAVLRHTF